jgi:hypothetical protein
MIEEYGAIFLPDESSRISEVWMSSLLAAFGRQRDSAYAEPKALDRRLSLGNWRGRRVGHRLRDRHAEVQATNHCQQDWRPALARPHHPASRLVVGCAFMRPPV